VTDPAIEEADFTATLPRKRMGAAVCFRDDVGRVLLVEPTYKRDWLLPGGAVEAGSHRTRLPRVRWTRTLLDRPAWTPAAGRLVPAPAPSHRGSRIHL
jgi:hypothetical protein